MKTKNNIDSNKSPSEQIDFVATIIRDRDNQQLPTYFSIAFEQYGNIIPLVDKEKGAENFGQKLLKSISDYDLNQVLINLYTNKAKNAKPFQSYRLNLKKQSPVVVLSGVTEKEENNYIPQAIAESSIPVHRYYDEKLSTHIQLLNYENEKNKLLDKIAQLQEKYEQQLREKEQSIKTLQNSLEEKEEEIQEFEKEVKRLLQAGKNSLGNISLAGVASHTVSSLLKSPQSTGFLKGLLGDEGYSRMQQHILAGTATNEEEEETAEEEQTKGGITIESAPVPQSHLPKDIQIMVSNIRTVSENLPKKYLLYFHEIAKVVHHEPLLLENIYQTTLQIKKQFEQFKAGMKTAIQVTSPISVKEENIQEIKQASEHKTQANEASEKATEASEKKETYKTAQRFYTLQKPLPKPPPVVDQDEEEGEGEDENPEPPD